MDKRKPQPITTNNLRKTVLEMHAVHKHSLTVFIEVWWNSRRRAQL